MGVAREDLRVKCSDAATHRCLLAIVLDPSSLPYGVGAPANPQGLWSLSMVRISQF
jgi:hypothetical protein